MKAQAVRSKESEKAVERRVAVGRGRPGRPGPKPQLPASPLLPKGAMRQRGAARGGPGGRTNLAGVVKSSEVREGFQERCASLIKPIQGAGAPGEVLLYGLYRP